MEMIRFAILDKTCIIRAGYVLTEDAYTRITVTEKPEWIIYRDNKTEKRYNIENLLFTSGGDKLYSSRSHCNTILEVS